MPRRLPKPPKKIQFARKCIFCETNNANSREHFYSEWMHDLLPVGPQGTYSGDFIDQHPKTKEVTRHDRRVKPGELYTKKMKVVCRACNNEWMSGIEEAAKPILEPLIKGEKITLGAAQLEVLAKWATLKTIVCEHDVRGVEVTPQHDRTVFMAEGAIPPYFNIYLLSHESESRIGYVRTSHAVSLSPGEPIPPLDGRKKNTQQISVTLGQIMLHINAARVDGFSIEGRLEMPAVVGRRIWPPNVVPMTWPSEPVLTNKQMRELAYGMEKIAALPNALFSTHLDPKP